MASAMIKEKKSIGYRKTYCISIHKEGSPAQYRVCLKAYGPGFKSHLCHFLIFVFPYIGILIKLHNCPVPQFPHLLNEEIIFDSQSGCED